jgi:hypothetical protein
MMPPVFVPRAELPTFGVRLDPVDALDEHLLASPGRPR